MEGGKKTKCNPGVMTINCTTYTALMSRKTAGKPYHHHRERKDGRTRRMECEKRLMGAESF